MSPGLEAASSAAATTTSTTSVDSSSAATSVTSGRADDSSRPHRDLQSLFDEVLAELHNQTRPEPPDVGLVDRAFNLATKAHAGQVRRSGEPYLIHPVRVARTIARLGLGACSVAAGLLHDSVEDSELTVPDVAELVGPDVAIIVDGVTKMGKVPYLSRQEQQAESFRKMLLAMSQDIRVLLVKLADRLDNMQTLEHMPLRKRVRISRETMEIYAPLAHQLGLQELRSELENLSFNYLEPAEYENVTGKVESLLAAAPRFIQNGVEEFVKAFAVGEEHGARGMFRDDDVRWEAERFGEITIKPRVRTTYEMYRAQNARDKSIDHASDIVQYEIIVSDRTACYVALGVVHSLFKPVPGSFRDHIALPRPNHYQALHTTVVNRSGVRRRVHIRSRAMDAVASRGIVAEWERDSTAVAEQSQNGAWRRPMWLKEVLDWQEEVSDPHEFIAAVKADLFADEVYVFTPQGDIRTFRKGATPIDFAFAIHTDVGSRASGARVNGQLVPLRYQLRQGDTVEIITSPKARPRREWLKMCRSARARARIKHFLRAEERTRLRSIGRSLIEQALGLQGRALSELEEQGVVAEKADTFHLGRDLKGVDGLYEAAGAGLLTVEKIMDVLLPRERSEPEPRASRSEANLFTRMLRSLSGRKDRNAAPQDATAAGRGLDATEHEGAPETPIQITRSSIDSLGSGGPMIQLASCCNPVPGDPLFGFFVPNKGIIAHVETCPDALELIGERRVYLAWEPGLELSRAVTVEVRTTNTVGLLAEMSRVFSHHGVNIKQANCRTYDSGQRAINTFHATVGALEQLHSLMQALQEIDGVLAVRRVFGRSAGYGYGRS